MAEELALVSTEIKENPHTSHLEENLNAVGLEEAKVSGNSDEIKENGANSEENEEEVTQVFIESDDEETARQDFYNRNGGLPYGDHNYDVFDKSKRRNNSCEVEFPIIGPLDEDGNILPDQSNASEKQHTLQQTSAQPIQVVHQQVQPMARTVTLRQFQQPLQDHQRGEPSIVARAPAHREGNVYRVTSQSDSSTGYSGYPATARSFVMQNRGVSNSNIRGRSLDASQIGQSYYGSVQQQQQQQQGNVLVRTTIQQRRPHNLQTGAPGTYQHVINPTSSAIRRNPNNIGTRPALLGTRTTIRQTQFRHDHDQTIMPVDYPQHQPASQQINPPVLSQRRHTDVAPHRMTPDQRMQQLHSTQLRTQNPVIEGGNAPMLIPGRGNKVVMRGRSGSMGIKRRDEEHNNIPHNSPQKIQYNVNQNQRLEHRPMSSSPRKMPLPETYAMPAVKTSDQLPAQLTEDPITDVEHKPTLSSTTEEVLHAPDNVISRLPMRNLSPVKSVLSQSIDKPTPPHRMTREEKNAHIAKHMEKEMVLPPIITAPITSSAQIVTQAQHTTMTPVLPPQRPFFSSPQRIQDQKPYNIEDDHVAKVVAEVAAAAAHANKSIEQSSKEKDEISRLANDLRISAESFSITPSHLSHPLTQRESDDVMVQNKMALAKREIEQERAMGEDIKKRRGIVSPNITAETSTQRPRGRPKGKTVNRNQNSETPKQGPRGVRTLPPVQRAAPLPKAEESPLDQKDSDSESDGVKNDDYGDSWTMRCHCGMKHGTGHCVECEKCEHWQHTLCMGLKPSDNLDGYQCEKCKPRKLKLSKAEAIKIQKNELKKLVAKADKGRRSKKDIIPKEDLLVADMLNVPYMDANEYSRSASKLLKSLSPTIGATDLLKNAKNFPKAKRMFVSENVEGLVSTEPVSAHAIVMEVTGYICLMDETTRESGGSSFVFQYDGLMKGPHGEDIGHPNGNELVVIDSRKKGNDAKYMRRSCTPNCVLKHVLDDNFTLGILIVSNENLQYNTEITIPFDNDYCESALPLHCAEHFGSAGSNCRIELNRLNSRIFKTPPQVRSPAGRKFPSSIITKQVEQQHKVETLESKNVDIDELGTSVVVERTRRLSSRGEAVKAREKDKEEAKQKEKERQKEREIEKSRERAEKTKKKEKEKEEKDKLEIDEEEQEYKSFKNSTVPRRTDKERTTTPVSSEKPKLSREDRMAQQYETLFQKQEEKMKRRLEKEKLKNEKVTESEKKESRASTASKDDTDDVDEEQTTTVKNKVSKTANSSMNEEKQKDEEITSATSTPSIGKRKSARVARLSMSSTTSDVSQVEKQFTSELASSTRKKRQTESDSGKRIGSTVQTPTAAISPPTKRLRSDSNNQKASLVENSTDKNNQKKQPLRKNNSEARKVPNNSTRSTGSTPSPAKKMRKTDESSVKCGDVLKIIAETLQHSLQFIPDFEESFKPGKDEKASRKSRHAQEIMKKNWENAQKIKKSEDVIADPVASISKEETPSTSEKIETENVVEKSTIGDNIEELPKKTQKKLSVADYKARKSTSKESPANKLLCSSQKEGFIPSTEGSEKKSVSLTPISLECEPECSRSSDADTNDDLKRLILLKNRMQAVDDIVPSNESIQTSPSSPNVDHLKVGINAVTTADESPQHNMSLKDRLFNEFGLGAGQEPSSSKNDNTSSRSRVSRWQ